MQTVITTITIMTVCSPTKKALDAPYSLLKGVFRLSRNSRMPTGGGLLQLVAQGKQDVFLTGNPQITWFKMVYRRYTNFAVDSQAMYFDGTADFGNRITCKVPIRGDLLGPLILEVTLPQITYVADSTAAAYVNSIGHALIEEISVEIGEQEIDKQTGEWMEVWSQLSVSVGQTQGYNAMIGRLDGRIAPAPTPPKPTIVTNSVVPVGSVKLYVPLQFWFCKNPGLYLPLLAMQYHSVRINIKLRSLQQLVYLKTFENLTGECNGCGGGGLVNPASIIDIRMYGDYIHLDVEERRRFVKNSHEYLIEQIQYSPQISIPAANTTATIPLEMNHPVREMIWLLQRDAIQCNNEWFNFTTTSYVQPGLVQDLLQDAVLQIDGYDRFEVRDAGYFRLVQPWQHHTNVPTSYIYNYSFALKPEELQPSGSINMSRIDTVKLQLTMRADTGLPVTNPQYVPTRGNAHIRIYATNHNVLRIVNGFAGLLFKI